MFAQILAASSLSQTDIDDFASFMEPEQAAQFLADVDSFRR